ncbi:DUF4179 domain-containing protein [Bacillus sp. Bva_UNVM-123]|uniref:DUF4179 domain-containing protein n=1 Tax=Bacillus sp. Bva_UNVM-123 TaxID=2829798 RepID=UPI00391EF755
MTVNNVEERLLEEKKRLDSISAPEELEERLRNALNTAPRKTKRIAAIWKIAVVALFFIGIASYQYNALAFYGKKLFGFDDVITGTLKELNDQGMGQMVDKKMKLKNGAELTINGILTDANQLVMYYTLSNLNGLDESFSLNPSRITGFLTESNAVSGTYLMNEDKTEMKGMLSFEPVSPFSKELTLRFWENPQSNSMTEGSISFSYNPNKAMQTEIKQSIRKTLSVDKGKITFQTITATPTSTVITGVMNVKNFDRVRLGLDGIQLLANGSPVPIMGSGIHSSIRGSKFDIQYDSLPKRLDSLELVVKEFVGYEKLNEKISLASISEESIHIGGKELWVKTVAKTSQGMEITIATDEDVLLDGVSIAAQNKKTPLRTTINQIEAKGKNGRILKERTLLFDSMAEPEYLLIEGMHYMKPYNKKIVIPVQ